MKSLLERLGIKNSRTKTAKVFESLFPENNFLEINCSTPREYVKKYWDAYKSSPYFVESKSDNAKNSLNGSIFETIIYCLLYREGILPFYTQAQVAFVPNVNFDTILYRKASPICLSLKTSLRERYKQADLEAIALKYVHRKAKCFLLTLDELETININNKIVNGEVIGLDKVVDCHTEALDDLIQYLKRESFSISEKVDVVEGNLVNRIDFQ